ncbi:hypothetical protein THAOC_14252, partial [Thalassiosira oceanica]
GIEGGVDVRSSPSPGSRLLHLTPGPASGRDGVRAPRRGASPYPSRGTSRLRGREDEESVPRAIDDAAMDDSPEDERSPGAGGSRPSGSVRDGRRRLPTAGTSRGRMTRPVLRTPPRGRSTAARREGLWDPSSPPRARRLDAEDFLKVVREFVRARQELSNGRHIVPGGPATTEGGRVAAGRRPGGREARSSRAPWQILDRNSQETGRGADQGPPAERARRGGHGTPLGVEFGR